MADEKSGEGRFERVFMLAAAAMLGGFAGASGMEPFASLHEGAVATSELVAEMSTSRPAILYSAVHDGEGLVASQLSRAQPGITLVQGIFPEGNAVVALDMNGRELHRWNANFFKVWPDADEVFSDRRRPKGEKYYFIQGMHPFADGSMLVNFGELGAAKIDACSNTIWRTDVETHHVITPTGDGRFWMAASQPIEKTEERLFPRGMTADELIEIEGTKYQNFHNTLVLVNADGEVERELSVLSAVHDASLEHALYASAQEDVSDPTHVNDIEIVTPALAAKIDGVEPGDLLLSMREMNMLAIVDSEDGRLLWHHQGPFVRQHDPDIMPDGTIEIFNNRSSSVVRDFDGSNIMRLDPASGKTDILFPVGKDDRFNSQIMGTHQALANGNRLITETTAGRIFEVTKGGEIVWDYRRRYDEEAAALFAAGMRVPEDYFAAGALACRTPAKSRGAA